MTVLFCDVTGSTALGENLDPEALRDVIGRYFAEMRAVVERHGGTVEKFIGDAVVAVFGVPQVHEDDALRAVRAAAAMQTSVRAMNEHMQRDYGVDLHVRIGVNTGDVIAGDPASESSFVSGDAVNVAARLEQSADPGEVLLGDVTYRLVRAAVIADLLPPVEAKGKSQPLVAHRLVAVEPGGEMLPRRFDVGFVGRREELSELRRAFEAVRSSQESRLVTIVGEAGLGKSRLALELIKSVGVDARILRGRCLPYGEGITFWPIAEIIEEAADIQPGDAPEVARAKVTALVGADPALARRLSALVGLEASGGALQETFFAVRRFLEAEAARAPVVVVFDDIQWGEDTFLDLVQYVMSFATSPLLAICLARPELLETRPQWNTLGETIRLRPLDATLSQDLVANLLGREEGPAGLGGRIIQASAGNPLYIEEMLRMLVDLGAIARKGDAWTVSVDPGEVPTPDTIQAVIAARLDRLVDAERALLQTAAVIGEVFWWSAVAELIDGVSAVEVSHRLQALVRKELIRPDPSSFFSDDAFRFGHLLIRDVAYESLPKKTRAALHERFARWVAERAGDRTAEYDEIIGYHVEQAFHYLAELAPSDDRVHNMGSSAAEHLAAAGRRAYDRSDVPAAVNLLSRAVALGAEVDPARPRLLEALGLALAEAGRLDDAEAAYRESRERAAAAGDRGLQARATMRLEFLRFLRSSQMTHKDFVAVLDAVTPILQEVGDERGIADAVRLRAIQHIWAGECLNALTFLDQAMRHAERVGDRRLRTEIKHWTGLVLVQGPTHAEDAINRLEDLRIGDEDNPILTADVRRFVAELNAWIGRSEEARRMVDESVRVYEELGMEVRLGSGALRASGNVAHRSGDLDRAEADLRRGVEILTRLGDNGHLASVAPDLALVLLSFPDREREALEAAELGERLAIDDDVDAQVRWRAAKGMALTRLGNVDAGERLARSAVERAEKTDYSDLRLISQEALADVLHRKGDAPEAVEAVKRAIDAAQAKGNVVSLEKNRRFLAEVEAARGSAGRQ